MADVPLDLGDGLEHSVGQCQEPGLTLCVRDQFELGGVSGERLELGRIRHIAQGDAVSELAVGDRGQFLGLGVT
ncbi:hypothetical protein ACFSSF_05790 [Dietzia aerolata]|uniref:hypothetical protein n=1 Tax=Dietzia aerolata TaxID=595984 RepID=UPI003640A100